MSSSVSKIGDFASSYKSSLTGKKLQVTINSDNIGYGVTNEQIVGDTGIAKFIALPRPDDKGFYLDVYDEDWRLNSSLTFNEQGKPEYIGVRQPNNDWDSIDLKSLDYQA